MGHQERPLYEQFLDAIKANRARLDSRRGFVAGGAKLAGGLAGGAAVALAVTGASRGPSVASAQDDASPVASPEAGGGDVDILNYALTLEHLEYAFYRDGLSQFGLTGFADAEQPETVYPNLQLIRTHESEHVAALTQAITDLGGTPVEEQTYDFGYEDVDTFLATAVSLEDTGVAAYAGAAPMISDQALLSTALGIHSVEARHASFVRNAVGEIPFPNTVDEPLTMEAVLEVVEPLIVGGPADETTGTPEAGTPEA